jgi:hypothetical protein
LGDYLLLPTDGIPYRDLKKLPSVYEENNELVRKLETAVATLQRTAADIKHKAEKRKKRGGKRMLWSNKKRGDDTEGNLGSAEQIVPRKKRPRHRVSKLLPWLPGWFPFIGQEVDTIEWCREELVKNKAELAEKRADFTSCPPKEAAFIEFQSQIAAHMFAQYVVLFSVTPLLVRTVDNVAQVCLP